MIRENTVTLDLQTIDAALPYKLMGVSQLVPGTARRIPGGMIVFQAAFLNTTPGEASMYRFV
ncbi:MAG TPA: hypothetical protein VK864_20870, partial [Longimicrobiales bacterium]|nr:hypothetical protein [Longimicrobiales bacterium]